MNISPIQSFTSIVNYPKEKESQKINSVEEKSREEGNVNNRDISKEEAALLLYQYKSTQSMKEQIDTLFDKDTDESQDDLEMKDYRELRRTMNAAAYLEIYKNDNDKNKIQEDSSKVLLYI